MHLIRWRPPHAPNLRIQIIQQSRGRFRKIDCYKQALPAHCAVPSDIDSLLRSMAASARPVNHRGEERGDRLCQPVRNSSPELAVGCGKNRLTAFIIKPVTFGAIALPTMPRRAANVRVSDDWPRRQA